MNKCLSGKTCKTQGDRGVAGQKPVLCIIITLHLTQYLTNNRLSIKFMEWMNKWKCQKNRGYVQVVMEIMSKEKILFPWMSLYRQIQVWKEYCCLYFFKCLFPILNRQSAILEIEG